MSKQRLFMLKSVWLLCGMLLLLTLGACEEKEGCGRQLGDLTIGLALKSITTAFVGQPFDFRAIIGNGVDQYGVAVVQDCIIGVEGIHGTSLTLQSVDEGKRTQGRVIWQGFFPFQEYLKAYDRKAQEFKATFPEPGLYELIIKADAKLQVPELNEDNNTLYISTTTNGRRKGGKYQKFLIKVLTQPTKITNKITNQSTIDIQYLGIKPI